MADFPSESEDEQLSDADVDPDYSQEDVSSTTSSGSNPEDSDADEVTSSQFANQKRREKIKPKWIKIDENGQPLHIPIFDSLMNDSDELEVGRPIHYFQLYFSDDLLDTIVDQSNLYSVQDDPSKPLQLTRSELEVFLGTVVYMSIFGLPRHRMYWTSACRIPKITYMISRNKWEEIKKKIHFNNNANIPPKRDDPDRDKLFKIRPIITHLKEKFTGHDKLQMLCIDEQIVPYKGRSSLKQYNPKKPNKWGYKIFILCGSKGLTHDFKIYTGKILPCTEKEDIGASGNIVLRIAISIPKHQNYFLFFDNWFTSLNLITTLHKDGIYSLGTVRKDRLAGLQFTSDKELKNSDRGTYEEYKTSIDNTEIRALKWFDNKSVCLVSTFCGSQPVDKVQRFDHKAKTKIDVAHPNIIKQYNNFMGGVNLLDGLISYYRIPLKSRKWYLRLFFHFIDLVVVNAWLRYRQDMEKAGLDKKDILYSLGFWAEVAEALCLKGKGTESPRKRDRPSSGGIEKEYQEKKKKNATKPIPQMDVRKDKVGHLPCENKEKRQRCRKPNCGLKTSTYCMKCEVYLCLKKLGTALWNSTHKSL